MKEVLIILGGIFFYQTLMAQTWSEWFEQNNTQLDYLKEQIAAIQAYQTTQQTGYVISEIGLELIDTTTSFDYTQHARQFGYLRNPSGNVLHDPRVMEIDTLLSRSGSLGDAILNLDSFRYAENDSRCQDFVRTLRKALQFIAAGLGEALVAGDLQMSDSEREERIEFLQRQVNGVYKDACRFFKTLIGKIDLP